MMIKKIKMFTAAVIATSLIGSSNALAASISKDGIKGNNGQILTDIHTFAGSGDLGSANGTRLSAAFRGPAAVQALPNGGILVADSGNHMIRSILGDTISDAAGVIFEMDAKGLPTGALIDGKSDASMFQKPAGIASDSGGNLYVADSGNHAVRKIDSAGNVKTIAGNGLIGSRDGMGKDATFYSPQDVAVAKDGTVYVADTLNHLIRSISPAGRVTTLTAPSVRAVGYQGHALPAGDYADGTISQAKFNEPTGLALDTKGNLYVADSGNHRIRYIDFTTGKVSTVAGGDVESPSSLYAEGELYAAGDYADGSAAEARFNYPMGIALTDEGGLLIADSQNNAIRYLHNGKVITLAGSPSHLSGELDGVDGSAQFYRPSDVTVDSNGTVYIADSNNNKIRRMDLYQLPDNLTAGKETNVVLGQEVIHFDAQPEMVNDRLMVPIRAIAEALGYEVEFSSASSLITLTKGDVSVEMVLGDTLIRRAEKNKETTSQAMDVSPYENHDRTYVPIRFLTEIIGLDVQWEQAIQTVILRPNLSLGE